MDEKQFIEVVEEKFRFLEKQYSANVLMESHNAMSYRVGLCKVVVIYDKGEVLVKLVHDKKEKFIWLDSIIRYKSPNVKREVPYIGQSDGIMELTQLANLVDQYCGDMLEGDYSNFDEIYKAQKQLSDKWLVEQYKKYDKK